MLRHLADLLIIFIISTLILIFTWSLRPELSTSSSITHNKPSPVMYFPRTITDLNVLINYFNKYREKHFLYLLQLFCLAYLYKQSFAIPGSFVMNVLAGALFGSWKALILVCPLTAIGASCCYLLSLWFAKPIIEYFFSYQLQRLRYEVAENQYRIFSFLLCARLFPFTPHWLLNVCLPHINIPLSNFALSTFIGLIPYNFLCVQAGSILNDLKDISDVFNLTVIVQLTGLAVIAFLFGKFMKKKTFCVGTINNCWTYFSHKIMLH